MKFSHWDGEADHEPRFEIVHSNTEVRIHDDEKLGLQYNSGPLSLVVNTKPNDLSFTFRDITSNLTSHSFRSVGYVSDISTPVSRFSDGIYLSSQGYVLAEFDLSVGEKLYGLGERFGPFVKNGQSIDIWNEDGGTSSELAYKNIPFYISSRGYGVFINNPGRVMLELQSERTTRVNIAIAGESLEYFVIYGSHPKDIIRRYTALTGRPSLPPAWSYGLWLTTSFTTSYSEDTVTGFLDGLRDRNIPLSVFHFDCFWMRSYQWCDFSFDTDMFPDPAAYIKRLKNRGLKISIWINPYIAQASPLFREGKKKGYFLLRSDTATPTVWQWDNWQAGMGIVDFTNAAACAWYQSHLISLIKLGVDSFKTDFGERIPWINVRYYSSASPTDMHNYYAYVYNELVHSTLRKYHPSGESCLFARAATVGCQRFPIHWGGDCESTWPAMAETLRGGLSLGLAGFAFWAHDIGGFEGRPPLALYKRWVQFGLLSSHSRLHGSSSYRVPWLLYDDTTDEADSAADVLRRFVLLKLRFLPYLLAQGLEAARYGTPLLRAMFLEFPHDPNVWTLDTQYMLGESLLVAPVFTADGVVTFYVPNAAVTDSSGIGSEETGHWRSYFDSSKTYVPGRWYTETHGFETLPLLVRPGAVVPVNPLLEDPVGWSNDYLTRLEVLANIPLKDEGVEVTIVDPQNVGKVARTFRVVPTAGREEGGGLEVRGEADVKLTIL